MIATLELPSLKVTHDEAKKEKAGKYAGQDYQKLQKCAESLYTVDARKVAWAMFVVGN